MVATWQELTAAPARIATLTAEPTGLARPADMLAQERDAWRTVHDAARCGLPPPR